MNERSFITKSILMVFLITTSCIDRKHETLFSLLQSSETGITFKNELSEKYDDNILRSEYFYNGGGVSAGDINNDGLIDLYFISNQGNNKLYLNKGDFQFQEITESALVKGHSGWATSSTMVDINTDGYLDIYVSYSRSSKQTETHNQLFINNKDLTFTEGALPVGAHDRGQSNQSTFFDYDMDGDLDMLVTNHLSIYPELKDTLSILNKTSLKAGDRLYRNDELRFKDVTKEAGINSHALGFSLGTSIGDVNQDGWPDIFIGNDFLEKDYLYINNKNGTFTESSEQSFGHLSNFSMGNDIADINNDGLLDIISLDMSNTNNFDVKTDMSGMNSEDFEKAIKSGFHYQYMYNTLQLNMGNGQFSDIAKIAGVSATDWSWAPLLADFDNDGYKDLFVSNGFRRNFRNKDFQKYQENKFKSQKWTKKTIPLLMKDLLENIPVKHIPNYIFKNKNGYLFEDKTIDWGINEPSFSNGATYADLDNDGDLDIIVNNIDQEAFIYRNNSDKILNNNYLKIKLEGSKRNNFGLGTKITVYTPDGKKQFIEHQLVKGYRSSKSTSIHFGLGSNSYIDSVLVQWSNSKVELLTKIDINQELLISFKDANEKKVYDNKLSNTFVNVSVSNLGIGFRHQENSFDDYKKQLLLPHKYSQFGPGVSVGDVNNDNLEDFYIGGASGQQGELYVQQLNGTFEIQKGPWKMNKDKEEMSSVFFDFNSDGFQDLYVVSGGNEWSHNNILYQDNLYINKGDGTYTDDTHILPDLAISGSKVRPCDYDNDGDIDLFIGGRLIAQQYPLPASGYILENNNGKLINSSNVIAPELQELGLITDAQWKDIDGDGDMDLTVVGEWMPITIFINEGTKLVKASNLENGLLNSEGWWYSLAMEDFDDDGDMDIMAGNIGLNYKYKANIENPFEVYASDFDENNNLDIVLGFYENDKLYPLRGKQCSSEQLPFINKKFETYEDFAHANVEDILGKQKMSEAYNLKAKTFASTYFENQGNGIFKANELPFLSQISSVNDIQIDDYNLDGNLDAVMIGNLYQSEFETPRNDASYGILLLGDGKGEFIQQFPYESGLYIKGDSKESNKIKINGVNHLLVTKNNDDLQLIKIKEENDR